MHHHLRPARQRGSIVLALMIFSMLAAGAGVAFWAQGDGNGGPAGPAPSLPSATAPRVYWTAHECSYVVAALTRDQQLDNAEVAALESGADTRYPRSNIPVYQEWARRWGVVLHQVGGICAVPAQLSAAAAFTQDQTWFRQAAQDHLTDAETYPSNADWDQQWIAVYRRLVADFQALYR